MQLDCMFKSCAHKSRNWLARLPPSRSLLLSLDAFPLPSANAAGQTSFEQPPQCRVQTSAAAAFSRALLSRPSQRSSLHCQATALDLDEIEVLATPEEVQAESQQSRGPFDVLGCDDRVTVNLLTCKAHAVPLES